MEVIAMENNNLKEQVRKDVKEKIAVSNIREDPPDLKFNAICGDHVHFRKNRSEDRQDL